MTKPKVNNAMFRNYPKSRVLKQTTRLNAIVGNPKTAYKFDPQVTKIEVVLAQKHSHKPSIGLRQFWKFNLPTLKFHNEGVDFQVRKVEVEKKEDYAKIPVKIVVHKDSGVDELSLPDSTRLTILQQLVQTTNATAVSSQECDLWRLSASK